jgi:methyl-accepting chemotaxis protein
VSTAADTITAVELARVVADIVDDLASTMPAVEPDNFGELAIDLMAAHGHLAAIVRLLAENIQKNADALYGVRWTLWSDTTVVVPGDDVAADILAAAGRRHDTVAAELTDDLDAGGRRAVASRFLDIAAGLAGELHRQEALTR